MSGNRARCLILVLILCCLAPGIARANQVRRDAVAITESGTGADRRFTVIADNAEITDLLKQLFAKTGDEFSVEQGVAGPITLLVRDATLDQVFNRITEVARPPLKIRHEGNYYRVAVDTSAPAGNPPGVVPGGVRPGIRRVFPDVPAGYEILNPGNRLVTIDVPKDHPIPLSTALARISAQTGYLVRLDPHVRPDTTFTGTIVKASLSMVLQAIADTTRLRIVDYGTYALLVPTPEFQIRFNTDSFPFPAITCPNCHASVSSAWNYCPNCGTPLSRATPHRPQK